MATNFPTSIDSYTAATGTDTLATQPHSTMHNNVQDAVAALEAKVGVDASTVNTSLDYLVKSRWWSVRGTIFEDFIGGLASNGAGPFNLSATGTGAAWAAGSADTTSVGVLNGTSGTTTTGSVRVGAASSGFLSTIVLGSGAVTYECRFRLTQLSTGTDTFSLKVGLNDNSAGGDATDGVYIRYTDGVNAGKFQLVTRSNSTETATDTGVTAAATTWYVVKITVNAAGTSTTCDINGTAVTATTNIPTGTARATGIVSSILKSAGTTAVTWDVDYIAFVYSFTTPR